MDPAVLILPIMMPLPFVAVGILVWLVVSVKALTGQILTVKFLYLALSIRFMANFVHSYTAYPLVAGQSINSLIGLAIIVIGLFFSRNHLLRYKAFLPVYLFVGLMIFSALYNGSTDGLLNAVLRQALFIVIVVTFVRVLDSDTHDGSLPALLLSIFAAPLVMQLMSIIFDIRNTQIETDGSASFIGGYYHEGVFSVMMLCGLSITVMSRSLAWRKATIYAAVFFTAIFFANYRTVLLAAMPLMAGHLLIGSGQGFKADLAVVVRISVGITTLVITVLLFTLLAQRLTDIATAAQDVSSLFKPPELFATQERKLFSGRILIWSDYVFTTISGSMSHILIGFGPDAWEDTFAKYAHNVYVSYIYEFGFIGVAVHLSVTLSFFWMALSTRHSRRWAVVACHLGYTFVSFGTMPTVTIEGVLLYATICGYTMYYRLTSDLKTPFLLAENARYFASRQRNRLRFS